MFPEPPDAADALGRAILHAVARLRFMKVSKTEGRRRTDGRACGWSRQQHGQRALRVAAGALGGRAGESGRGDRGGLLRLRRQQWIERSAAW